MGFGKRQGLRFCYSQPRPNLLPDWIYFSLEPDPRETRIQVAVHRPGKFVNYLHDFRFAQDSYICDTSRFKYSQPIIPSCMAPIRTLVINAFARLMDPTRGMDNITPGYAHSPLETGKQPPLAVYLPERQLPFLLTQFPPSYLDKVARLLDIPIESLPKPYHKPIFIARI